MKIVQFGSMGFDAEKLLWFDIHGEYTKISLILDNNERILTIWNEDDKAKLDKWLCKLYLGGKV